MRHAHPKNLAIPFLCLLLTACGGGAEKTTPNTPPLSITVTCPNGSSQTATTQALAEAACPLPAMLSITPAHGDTTVSPDTFSGITLATDSNLDPASLTIANVTLKIGSLTTIAGSVAASGAKGVQFVPTAKLQYGQAYDFAASVKDTLGRTLNVSSSFTTAALTCTLPQVLSGGVCVTPVTVNCPNGTTQTATTQALAEAQCPAPVLVGQGSGTPVDPLTFGGTAVNTDSLLNQASINAVLSLNGVPVAGTNAMSANGKGFVFTPSTTLAYSSTYQFTASVQDTLGKSLTVNSTITTIAQPLVTCTPPDMRNNQNVCVSPPAPTGYTWDDANQVWIPTPVNCTLPSMKNSMNTCMSPPAPTGYTWNDIIKAWVADVGVLVTGANLLPAGCVTIGDACWLESVANGTIKFANSGVVMTGVNTRPIIFAYYHVNLQVGAVVYDVYNYMPLYADVQASSPSASQLVGSGGVVNLSLSVKGTASGIKYDTSQGCFERVRFPSSFGTITATCPI